MEMEEKRFRLGEMLVRRGLVSEQDVAQALAAQAASGQPLGQVLVGQGLISPAQLAAALREQQGRESTGEFFSGLLRRVEQREQHRDDAPGATVDLPSMVTARQVVAAAGFGVDWGEEAWAELEIAVAFLVAASAGRV
jgi:nucleoside-diphosphate-sugar epimerase